MYKYINLLGYWCRRKRSVVQQLTSVDVHILPQMFILLQVLQEVLVLSKGRETNQDQTQMAQHYRLKKHPYRMHGTLAQKQTIHHRAKNNDKPLVTLPGILSGFPYFLYCGYLSRKHTLNAPDFFKMHVRTKLCYIIKSYFLKSRSVKCMQSFLFI